MIGGAIPYVRAGHSIGGGAVREHTWWIEITWLRIRMRIEVTR